jgi:hypothetical protein
MQPGTGFRQWLFITKESGEIRRVPEVQQVLPFRPVSQSASAAPAPWGRHFFYSRDGKVFVLPVEHAVATGLQSERRKCPTGLVTHLTRGRSEVAEKVQLVTLVT